MSSKNFAYLNDSLCAIDEDNADATVYQSGLYNVIVYHHTGKVALMKEGQFVGYLKWRSKGKNPWRILWLSVRLFLPSCK